MDTAPIKTSKLLIFVESQFFQNLITTAIVLNAITLGLETVKSIGPNTHQLLFYIDVFFVAFFVIEMLVKGIAYRMTFWKNGWNIFDLLIIIITVIPFFGNITVLRSMRILRVLRLISIVPRFRVVVRGFFEALSNIAAVGSLMLIVFYTTAVMTTKLFGEDFPDLFGTIPVSFFTLFHIMTLQVCTDEIVRPVMEIYPYAWLIFIPFILVATFAVLNLLIGVIVNSMQNIHDEEEKLIAEKFEEQDDVQDTLISKVEAIQNTLNELKDHIDKKKN